MRKTLSLTSLLSRFEGRMFSSADVPRGKPFPDLFLFAASHFAVAPAACLVVEDSASGIAAALGAGMPVYGFSGSTPDDRLIAAGAQKVFRQMSELPSLVAGTQ
jgi:beta-phosphoglucomutase-like phosphatase (HAD superfamily)